MQRYFILSNSTNETISVKYSFDDPTSPTAIFNLPSEIYQSTKGNTPNWEHQLPYKDLDISNNNVYIKLPPKSTLLFGILNNDDYDMATMKSESGKLFNLKQMKFTVSGTEFLIDKGNFHNFFLKEAGMFRYVIQ